MAAPIVTFLYNNSQNNTPNTGGSSGDSNWKVFNPINDKLSFLGPGTNNDDPTTSKSVFTIPDSGNKEATQIFINQYIESKWKKVWLAGSNADSGGGGDYRYALGFYIDGTTTSSPVLQAWDSTSHSSISLQVLGGGTPANSMIRVVSGELSAPGDSWSGTPLAGDGFANTIALKSASLDSPYMAYFNVRLLVPSVATPFAEEPVLCLYLTYS